MFAVTLYLGAVISYLFVEFGICVCRFVCFPSLILHLLEVILQVFVAVLRLVVFVILHLYIEFKIHFECVIGFFPVDSDMLIYSM